MYDKYCTFMIILIIHSIAHFLLFLMIFWIQSYKNTISYCPLLFAVNKRKYYFAELRQHQKQRPKTTQQKRTKTYLTGRVRRQFSIAFLPERRNDLPSIGQKNKMNKVIRLTYCNLSARIVCFGQQTDPLLSLEDRNS